MSSCPHPSLPAPAVPPSQETRAGSPGPYSGAGMLCQHFPGPGAGGEGLVQDQQTWPRTENVPSPPHTPTPSRTTGRKNGKDSEMGSPSSILSPCPLPRPQKNGLFWEGHLLFQYPALPPPPPSASQGSEMRGETQSLTLKTQCGLKLKNKARDRETEMERDRGADNPKRQIRRDTTQRPLASIFDPPLKTKWGKKEDPEPEGPSGDPPGLGVQRSLVCQPTPAPFPRI